MQRDLHNNIATPECIPSQTVGTTGTGRTSSIVDRLGYEGVEFVINYGSISATNAVFTPNLQEASATGGPFTSVADIDMLPQANAETGAGIGATASRVSGVSKNVSKKLGYIGTKRYLKLKVSSTVTAGANIAADAILHSPTHAPAGKTEI